MNYQQQREAVEDTATPACRNCIYYIKNKEPDWENNIYGEDGGDCHELYRDITPRDIKGAHMKIVYEVYHSFSCARFKSKCGKKEKNMQEVRKLSAFVQ